jgi:hypothetical protein
VTSGARVVIALLGGALAIAGLVVVVFLLTDKGNLQCDEGEASTNPTAPNGAPLPLNRTFDSVSDAESFICHRVAYPRDTRGFDLATIGGVRTRGLADIIDGEGFAEVALAFARPPASQSFELRVTPFTYEGLNALEASSPEAIRIQREPVELVRDAANNRAIVQWQKGGLMFRAEAQLGDGFSLEELLQILETTR